jgi:bifunctional non-homologous end joining protein LigD
MDCKHASKAIPHTVNGGIPCYIDFIDLPYLGGKDLTALPLLRRRELLKNVLPENEVIRFSGAVEGEGKRFFELASQRGLVRGHRRQT